MICTLIIVSTRGVLYTIIREWSTVYQQFMNEVQRLWMEWEMNPSFVLGDCVGQDW